MLAYSPKLSSRVFLRPNASQQTCQKSLGIERKVFYTKNAGKTGYLCAEEQSQNFTDLLQDLIHVNLPLGRL